MKKLTLTLFLCLMSICMFAQKLSVTGVVTDADEQPLIGATVAVVGTTQGVITDFDGKFSIEVENGQVLNFSYIGYQEQSVKITSQNTVLKIKMVEGDLLEEVVVIGYGTVKKSHLTGAVSSVSGKELQANVARSASAALQGRVPGVTVASGGGQPGDGMNINVRGVNSMSGSTPLYVIDGVYGDINMVDPSDIQSIEVLKDASAAAIYGSRAANGVVLITTKGGRLETPTRITVDAYAGVQTVSKYLDLMDGNELRDFAKNTGYSSAPGLTDWNGGKGTDWQKEVYDPAMVTKVALNVSGGNKTSTYNLSGSYTKQDGIVKTTGYEAWNFRTKNTFSLFNNHLRMGSTMMMKFSKMKYQEPFFLSIIKAVPQWTPFDEEGKWGVAPNWTRGDNPVGTAEAFDDQKHRTEILLNGYAELDLGLKGLKYKLNVGVNKYQTRGFNYVVPFYFSTTSVNNEYQLKESSGWENDWLVENTLHYDNVFGDHTVSALAGYSAQRNEYRGIGAGRFGLPMGLQTINAGSVATATNNGSAWANSMISIFGRLMYSYADRYMISASIRRDGSSKFADGNRWGTFPSVSIGWNVMNEKFFEKAKETMNELKVRASYGVLGNLNGIGNYATQSTVRNGLNNVMGNQLWEGATTGFSWVSPTDVTWEKTKTMNFGLDMGFFNNKLTISGDYFIQKTEDMLLSMPMPGSFGLGGNPTVNAGTIENNGFEFSINHRNMIGDFTYHVGLNASFIKNELTEVNGPRDQWEGFNPNGKGTITYAETGYPIGYFKLIKTDGIFQNEAEIQAHKNSEGKVIQPNAKPGDLRFVDLNDDGKISNEDRQDCGTAFPKMTLGLNLGGAYKGLDFNLFFDGNFGNKIYNGAYFNSVYNEVTGNQFAHRLDSWTESNTDTDEPRYVSGNDANGTNWGYTDRWLENGSFLRLKTLELGYTFPKAWVSKAKMQSLRVYTAMENLFTITKYRGLTPDLGINSNTGSESGNFVMSRGCDYGRYPLARTITFGLQLNF